MNKADLFKNLTKSYDQVIGLIENIDDAYFLAPTIKEKWSGGQQLEHLIMTNTSILKGFSAPKEFLEQKFGLLARPAIDIEEVITKYSAAASSTGGIKAPAGFEPKQPTLDNKSSKIDELKSLLGKTIEALDQWEEEDIKKYCLFHPLIGPLSISEMTLFQIFHNGHHQKQVEAQRNR